MLPQYHQTIIFSFQTCDTITKNSFLIPILLSFRVQNSYNILLSFSIL